MVPKRAGESPGSSIVADVGPEERLVVVALVVSEREELPEIGLSRDEVLEGRRQDTGELAGDVAESLGETAGQAAHLLRSVLADGPEIVLPFRDVGIEGVVQALEELQDDGEHARDGDAVDVPEVGQEEEEVRSVRAQGREVVVLAHDAAEPGRIRTLPAGIDPLAS